LSHAQRAALLHVHVSVRAGAPAANRYIADVIHRAGCEQDVYDRAIGCLAEHARVAVHFHPDRLSLQGRTAAEGLLRDGVYGSQFETGISTGAVSAFAGGARDNWERTLFGGAYHLEGVSPSERPKYGALELVRHSDGPIPRFGSCYLVLGPGVSKRTTFTFGGSEDPHAPERLGTIDEMNCVIAGLFAEVETGGFAEPPWPPFKAPTLGIPDITVARWLALLEALSESRQIRAEARTGSQ
jgi:hypothetical protein